MSKSRSAEWSFVGDDNDDTDDDDAVREDEVGSIDSLDPNRGNVFPRAFSFQFKLHDFPSFPEEEFPFGWLYNHVAVSTITDPKVKVKERWKSNSATDARKDITMLRLVAKPLRILSEYLITKAVTKPPKTWIATVAHAQPPNSWNKPLKPDPAICENTTGRRAGRTENADNWTLRTQRSACEFFRTISKYTPASPDVKQAATTAKNPLSAFIECTSMDDEEMAAEAAFTELPPLVCICTMPTPIARKKRASH